MRTDAYWRHDDQLVRRLTQFGVQYTFKVNSLLFSRRG